MSFEKVIPPPLLPGETIAVISPAAPTHPPDKAFEKGVSLLEAEGFEVKLMPHAQSKDAYLAGTDEQRLADLEAAFTDPQVKGILCARGGYGCMRLLPQLDMNLIRKHPKVFMGFSDVTVLHLAFYEQAGLTGFYSPMLTSNLIHGEPYSQKELFDMVCGRRTVPYPIQNRDPYTCIKPGVVEAPLIGGNLTLLAALCGTKFQPKTEGHILFIEDWKEKYYSIDRQFQQMKMAGLLDGIKGLLFCDFSELEPEPEFELAELFRRLTADLDIPIGSGFSVGHGEQTATLPIGIKSRFDAKNGNLILVESPVSLN